MDLYSRTGSRQMKYVIIFLIISFAAIANSAMDQIKFNMPESIFVAIKNQWLRMWVCYDSVYEKTWMHPFLMFLCDDFHHAKGWMIALFIGGISYFAADNWIERIAIFFGASLVFMVHHMVFFNGVFKR